MEALITFTNQELMNCLYLAIETHDGKWRKLIIAEMNRREAEQ